MKRAESLINMLNEIAVNNRVYLFPRTSSVSRCIKSKYFISLFYQCIYIFIKIDNRGFKAMYDQCFTASSFVPTITCYSKILKFETEFFCIFKYCRQPFYIPVLRCTKQFKCLFSCFLFGDRSKKPE